MVPTLQRVAGPSKAIVGPLTGTAEDFSYFQQQVPGLFFFLGVTPPGQEATAAANHSPLFFADEIGAAGRRAGAREPDSGLPEGTVKGAGRIC